MTRVAWIGTGAMGSRMAQRLLDAGYPMSVWNRTASRAETLVAAGATRAATPAEAVRDTDIVVLMLADSAAVEAIAEGANGIASAVRPGMTVIDMSTSGPGAITRLRTVLPDGVDLLDAPVLGSLTEAENGTLQVFIGGRDEALSTALPLLTTLGNPIHIGPSGAGIAAKLVANSTLLGVLGVLGEALALADSLGLSPAATWEVLATTPLSQQAARRRQAVESNSFPTRFALSLARKDADLVLTAAQAQQVLLRLAPAMRDWLADAEVEGLGTHDYSAVLRRIIHTQPGSA